MTPDEHSALLLLAQQIAGPVLWASLVQPGHQPAFESLPQWLRDRTRAAQRDGVPTDDLTAAQHSLLDLQQENVALTVANEQKDAEIARLKDELAAKPVQVPDAPPLASVSGGTPPPNLAGVGTALPQTGKLDVPKAGVPMADAPAEHAKKAEPAKKGGK